MSRASLLRWMIALLFIGGFAAFFVFGGPQWLSLESLKAYRETLLIYTRDHYVVMILGFGLVYTASTALSVPGATVLSLAGGLLFGRWIGTLVVVISATLGATLVFLGARYLFAQAAQRRLEQSPRARRLLDGFQENAVNYLLFLRLVPLFPFWLVNLAPAFTGVSTRLFFVATLFGIIPGAFVYVNLGTSLGRIDSLGELVSPEVLAGLVLLGLFALLPTLVKRRRSSGS